VNAKLRKEGKVSKSLEEMERREQAEKRFFEYTTRSNWEQDSYNEGRLSGSLAWRIARGEVGNNSSTNGNNQESNNTTSGFSHNLSSAIKSTKAMDVETFTPSLSETFKILVRARPLNAPRCFPECITVSDVNCAAGIQGSINIVVIDQNHACILLSRMFSSWAEAASFLSFIPDGRVIAIVSDVLVEVSEEKFVETHIRRISGLSSYSFSSHRSSARKTLLSIGQMNVNSDWATCELVDPGMSIMVSLRTTKSFSIDDLQLSAESGIVPRIVIGRIPDHIMPLEQQLNADDEKKKSAFLSFNDTLKVGSKYVGFTSKKGLPIYLMNNHCFPLKPCSNDDLSISEWKTFYYVPKVLAKCVNEPVTVSNSLRIFVLCHFLNKLIYLAYRLAKMFDLPVNESFFSSLIGPTLLHKKKIMGTSEALSNKRLIAFYFSAHWCPPCRQFTPMLCEFYDHVNEAMPTALEIIFISSDRDPSSFGLYYAQMPWLAVPYESINLIKHSVSTRYVHLYVSQVIICN
jgi:nucleoredoxin